MQSNIHEIYGSICGSKCESGFDWSTFVLTVVIFDWHCQCHTFLANHRAVVLLKKNNLQGCAREGLGNDILALHSCNTSMTCALEIHSESFYLFNKISIILLFTTSNDSEKSKCLTLL